MAIQLETLRSRGRACARFTLRSVPSCGIAMLLALLAWCVGSVLAGLALPNDPAEAPSVWLVTVTGSFAVGATWATG